MAGFEKWGGLAAVVGGALRVIASFAPVQQHAAAPYLYLAIDWLLLCGLFALYAAFRQLVGRIGLAALFAGAAAICIIRTQAALGGSAYQVGAAILLVSMLAFAVAGRRHRAFAIAGALWLMSLLAGVVAMSSGAGPISVIDLAGAFFGLGFMVAGGAVVGKRLSAR